MIGELLMERGVINEFQLQKALAAQRAKGGYISQHLITLGYASEFDVANCLASQFDFAYLPLANYEVPPEILNLVPFRIINIFSVLPIDKVGNILSVAMADPLNDGVVEMLKQCTGCDITPFISTYTELRRAIEKYYGTPALKSFSGKTAEEIRQQEMLRGFIQTAQYQGFDRRRSVRVPVDLEMVYFLQDKVFKGRVKNLSLNGVLFGTDVFLPVDKNIYAAIVCKFILGKETVVNSVVQVVRVEDARQEASGAKGLNDEYLIGAFFNFITEEDLEKIKVFLSEKLKATGGTL
jgi:hypothetical protein